MPYTNPALKAGVDGIAAAGAHISFHTADPGTNGANEVAGGSPAYARQLTTWAATTTGVRTGSQVTANIPANTTVTHWGVWSAVTAGTFLYGGTLPANEPFGSAGQIQHTPTLTVSN